ncbi:DUF5677 domain-containing protein [Trueperella pyogenes]|uniref:DUF5677 domain-containing protein n=1 Tax=Trueperella pyogenes TaxID=1661 RepID=UPI00345D38F8
MGTQILLFHKNLTLSSRSLYALASHYSVGVVLTQFINDVDTMVMSADRGEGRDVARAARSTFEHLINLSDLISSSPLQQQYLDHAEVTKFQFARLPPEYQMGLSQNSYTIKQLENKVEQLTNKYHSNFERQWHKKSLYKRAEKWGYTTEYDVYRILSSLVHGSAGGILGNEKEIQNHSVLRAGPNYELASFALLSGLRFARLILQRLQTIQVKNVSPQVLKALIKDVDHAILGCADYQNRISTINQELWPTKLPQLNYQTVGAKYPGGKCAWFIHNLQEGEMYPALSPGLPEIEKRLQDEIPTPSRKEYELNGNRPTTVIFENVYLQVKTPLKTIPDHAVLMPRHP